MSDFLPPIPRPPDDPTSWLLNARVGWRGAPAGTGVEIAPGTGRLALAPLPGGKRTLADPGLGGLVFPASVAAGPDNSVYLLDPRTPALKRFDPCECAFVVVPCFGGAGDGPRRLLDPHGIGIRAGDLFVCDTGNHRLGVFRLNGFLLRGHWRPPDGRLPLPWQPVAVAFDRGGRVYVADGANACVHRFTPAGRWEIFLPVGGKPVSLAIDGADRLYVARENEPNRVHVFDLEGAPVGTEERVEALASRFPRPPFPVDAQGRLHLGPLCAAGKPQDAAVFDLHGEPIVLAPPPDSPPAYPKRAYFLTEALDSELYRCQWHRVLLRGRIPAGASVEVATYTAEAVAPDEQIQDPAFDRWETKQVAIGPLGGEWDCLVASGGGRFLWLRLELRGDGASTPELDSVEIEFPRISLRRFLPAVFGAEPGSADFTDRFLGLFDTTLRSIEKQIDTQARLFDPLSTPARRDPKTGQDFLTWLGTWIGLNLDRHWPEAKRRRLLKEAGRLYERRGTREGLRRLLLLFLGIEAERCCCPGDAPRETCVSKPPNCAPAEERPCAWEPPRLILEHYQLRRWLFVGAGRLGDQAALWGQRIVNRSQLGAGAQVGRTQLLLTQDPYRDPFHVYAHRFTVFVPARCGATDRQRKALENLLRGESPAQALGSIEYVRPRFRIGVQSMIGLDSVIGRLPEPGVTLSETRLGGDTILGGTPPNEGAPAWEVGKQGRIGTTTRLE